MTAEDIPAGLALGRQNGWNQLTADWQQLLHMQPDGCFVAARGETVVGTACGLVLGSVAWVAMVLVEAGQRGRGIGTALMRHVLSFLDSQQVPTIRLDATPLGRPIYERLGFVAEYELARYEGVLTTGASAPSVEAAAAADLPNICRLDAAITGADRRKFLEQLWVEQPQALRLVRNDKALRGFASSRPGARAVQIGPCLGDANAGRLLLADACSRHVGRMVFIDIPVSHRRGSELARAYGLTVQRHLLRMCQGPTVLEQTDHLWASSGPEKG
jgi:GNAT superfamily N-acetyltransferase